MQGVRWRVQDVGYRAKGLAWMDYGLGIRAHVKGLGFRV